MTFEELKRIVKRIPIAYYSKYKIELDVSETSDNSMYMFAENTIYISLKQINSIDFSKFSEDEKEHYVRPMIFHEVSHALLTPSDIFKRINDLKYDYTIKTFDEKELRTVINIVEDERIEYIMKGYFIDCDFVEFKRALNDYSPNYQPDCLINFIFYIVRFQQGPENLVKLAKRIISNFIEIKNEYDSYDYINAIYSFYELCKKYYTSNSEDVSKESQMLSRLSSEEDGDRKESDKRIAAIIENTVNPKTKYDYQFEQRLEMILYRKSGMKSNQVGSKFGYTGQVDPKRVNHPRSEYKWFVRPQGEQTKRGQIVKLNLFIDNSGSFINNETTVNKYLQVISKLEKRLNYFEYTLTTINDRIVEHDKGRRSIKCQGCNQLPSTIFNIFKSKQDRAKKTYNIVMFDGKAYQSWNREETNFKAFNTDNTLIISDVENARPIQQYCKRAKVIILTHHDYCKYLSENILKFLERSL